MTPKCPDCKKEKDDCICASHAGGQVMSEYQPGIECRCCAHSENECCCPNVDWRSTREVELEALVEKLEQQLATPVLNETKGNK